MAQNWTIQQVARTAGTTSRTLRHYDQIGLLKPTAIAQNGYRLYDASALIRLQRILALRDLGLSLPHIQSVLDRDLSEIDALADLETQLEQESSRLTRQIATVRRTLTALKKGESPMSANMFEGFEHEQFEDEVVQKYGKQAWQQSNDWWKSIGEKGQQAYQQKLTKLVTDWHQASLHGESANSDVAQALAQHQVEWLSETPGPHTNGECTLKTYVTNLAEMYVNDPRFAESYGGPEHATLVRDAIKIYADKHL